MALDAKRRILGATFFAWLCMFIILDFSGCFRITSRVPAAKVKTCFMRIAPSSTPTSGSIPLSHGIASYLSKCVGKLISASPLAKLSKSAPKMVTVAGTNIFRGELYLYLLFKLTHARLLRLVHNAQTLLWRLLKLEGPNDYDSSLIGFIAERCDLLERLLGLNYVLKVAATVLGPLGLRINPGFPGLVSAIALALFVANFVDSFKRQFLGLFFPDIGENRRQAYMVNKSSSVIIWTVCVLVCCEMVSSFLKIPLSSTLAFGGFGGIAAGLSVRDVAANLVGGMILLLNEPFTPGDMITFRMDGVDLMGRVERVGWAQTRIRGKDTRPIYVPNMRFVQTPVVNMERLTHRKFENRFPIRFQDHSKLEAVVSRIKERLRDVPKLDRLSMPFRITFTNVEEHSLNIAIVLYFSSRKLDEFLELQQTANIEIVKAIHEAGAELAVPATVLHIASSGLPPPTASALNTIVNTRSGIISNDQMSSGNLLNTTALAHQQQQSKQQQHQQQHQQQPWMAGLYGNYVSSASPSSALRDLADQELEASTATVTTIDPTVVSSATVATVSAATQAVAADGAIKAASTAYGSSSEISEEGISEGSPTVESSTGIDGSVKAIVGGVVSDAAALLDEERQVRSALRDVDDFLQSSTAAATATTAAASDPSVAPAATEDEQEAPSLPLRKPPSEKDASIASIGDTGAGLPPLVPAVRAPLADTFSRTPLSLGGTRALNATTLAPNAIDESPSRSIEGSLDEVPARTSDSTSRATEALDASAELPVPGNVQELEEEEFTEQQSDEDPLQKQLFTQGMVSASDAAAAAAQVDVLAEESSSAEPSLSGAGTTLPTAVEDSVESTTDPELIANNMFSSITAADDSSDTISTTDNGDLDEEDVDEENTANSAQDKNAGERDTSSDNDSVNVRVSFKVNTFGGGAPVANDDLAAFPNLRGRGSFSAQINDYRRTGGANREQRAVNAEVSRNENDSDYIGLDAAEAASDGGEDQATSTSSTEQQSIWLDSIRSAGIRTDSYRHLAPTRASFLLMDNSAAAAGSVGNVHEDSEAASGNPFANTPGLDSEDAYTEDSEDAYTEDSEDAMLQDAYEHSDSNIVLETDLLGEVLGNNEQESQTTEDMIDTAVDDQDVSDQQVTEMPKIEVPSAFWEDEPEKPLSKKKRPGKAHKSGKQSSADAVEGQLRKEGHFKNKQVDYVGNKLPSMSSIMEELEDAENAEFAAAESFSNSATNENNSSSSSENSSDIIDFKNSSEATAVVEHARTADSTDTINDSTEELKADDSLDCLNTSHNVFNKPATISSSSYDDIDEDSDSAIEPSSTAIL